MHLTIKEGLNELKDDKGKLFYGYVPKTVVDNPAGAGILVSIHGYGGRKKDSSCLKRVRKCAEIWSDFANNWRRIILTPHFDLKSFNNRYQQLNLFGRRTDIYLNELIEKMGMLLPGIKNDKIMLFGFSGGGQFVHRYVAFHPERVESAVAAAAACCRALSTSGYSVRASKVTGTSSLKDILHMNDAGASHFSDFSHLGYPSTYLMSEEDIINVFNMLDLKYANNPKNYWVVEFADGVIQRETAILLSSPEVQSRIHKFIFCAVDAFGMIGGINILRERYGLTPDALSGICSSSPLHIKELAEFTDIPIFNSVDEKADRVKEILVKPKMKDSRFKKIPAALADNYMSSPEGC